MRVPFSNKRRQHDNSRHKPENTRDQSSEIKKVQSQDAGSKGQEASKDLSLEAKDLDNKSGQATTPKGTELVQPGDRIKPLDINSKGPGSIQKAKTKAKGAGAGAAGMAGAQGVESAVTGAKGLIAAGKDLAGSFLSMGGKLAGTIGHAITSAASTVASGFTSAVAGIASGLGVSSLVAGGIAVASVAVPVTLVGGLVIGMMNPQIGMFDGNLKDCAEQVQAAKSGGEMDAEGHTIECASKLYSIFHTYGLSDIQIAGIVGNFDAESGIDPTSIEGYFDEPHQNGPGTKKIIADLDSYTRKLGASGYGYVNNPFYTASDGKKYCGIGLGQWTGENTKRLLEFAQGSGFEWCDIEFQAAYMLATPSPTGITDFWSKYKAQDFSSASDAALYFARNWEGNTGMALGKRTACAEKWVGLFKDMTVDIGMANKILDLAKSLGAEATDAATSKELNKCAKVKRGNNSSIADAAVAYAWERPPMGSGNNGTALYQAVHNAIFPGDPYYMSCDRGVACAIRWSGSDDDMIAGPTEAMIPYCEASPRWEHVGNLGSMSEKDLDPGDVALVNGHVWMYVGNETVKKVYPSSDGNSVSASFGQRSPEVTTDLDWYKSNGGCEPAHGMQEYRIYRCVDPQNSPKYKDAGAGAS